MNRKLKKYKVILVAVIFLFMCFMNNKSIAAQSDTYYYSISGSGSLVSLEELRSRFYANSIDILEANNTCELEATKYDTALDEWNNLVSSNNQTADAKLQVDLYQFAKTNQVGIKEATNKRLEAEFIKNCYKMIQNQEEKEYYSANAEYLSTAYYIASKKYAKGYVTLETVEQIQADMDVNGDAILENQNKKEMLAIDTEAGLNAVIVPITLLNKTYYEASCISLLKNNEYETEHLQYSINAYENYLINLKVASNTSAYRKVNLQIMDYQLQLQKRNKDIESYAKNSIKSYNLICRKCSSLKKKVTVAEKEYTNAQMQYKKGKIAKVTLNKALITKEEKDVEYYKACYEKMVWEFILDNGIYGITP